MSSELPDRWRRVALADLVDERGITYGVVQPGQPVEDGTPVLRVNNFSGGRLRLDDVIHIAPEIANRYQRSQLAGGEVLITLVGSVGQVAVAPSAIAGWNVARAVGVVPVAAEHSARWVASCLSAPQALTTLSSHFNTTVQTTLNLKDLAAFEIPWPPVTEQLRIMSVLGTLDGKIESNQKIATTCHAAVLAEFDHRFGSDWAGAKTSGKTATGGEWGRVGDLVELRYGKALKAEARAGGTVAVVGSSGIVGRHNRGLVDGPAVIVGRKGVAGSVRWIDEDVWPIDTTFYAVPQDGRPLSWLYGALIAARFTDVSGDSAVPGLNRETALARHAVVPAVAACLAFNEFAAPLMAKRAGATSESRTLAAIRDALLPKLVSGRIRVPLSDDPEEQVGAAVEALEA